MDEWDGDRWEVHMNQEEKRGGEEQKEGNFSKRLLE
jgi:hypothetical protein